MKTYELTAAQIVEIYNAGQESGHNSATAYEWGSPQPPELLELEEILIWGNGILTGRDIDIEEKYDIWINFKKEAGI